ncbi:hypothetical protein F5Y16DRAFT_403592 [Xylariaceae sp. FL0255]|nr:hypothetical protein F5Y16DRAFT_403592 [Xylariaceae sp. FL0255]
MQLKLVFALLAAWTAVAAVPVANAAAVAIIHAPAKFAVVRTLKEPRDDDDDGDDDGDDGNDGDDDDD